MKTCPQCGGTLYCDEPGFSEHLYQCRLRAIKSEEGPNYNSGELPRNHDDGDPFAYERARIAHYNNSFEANKDRDEMTRIIAAAKRRLARDEAERRALERRRAERREKQRVAAEQSKPELPEGYEFLEPGEQIGPGDLVYAIRNRHGRKEWVQTRRVGEPVWSHQWYKYARRKSSTGPRAISCTKVFTSGTFSLAAWRRRNVEVEQWAARCQALEGADVPLWIQVTRPDTAP